MSGGDHPSIFDSEATLAAALLAAVEDPDFPQYGYGVVQAAALAARLRIPSISVIELGVAGGNGLLCLQGLAGEYAGDGTQIDVYGFDLGSGMPAPVDSRDTPYIWQPGFFGMDESALRGRLVDAHLLLGEIAETGPSFLAAEPAPIGFISFDLDYYSSTISAMAALLNDAPERYLPRVICYFDDTVGPHHEMHSQFTGELLAIAEFNAGSEHRKIAEIRGLRYKLAPHDGSWIPGMHVLHLFDHPRYNDYIYPVADRQFPLTETGT
jgi:hypothetical protein